MLSSTVMATLLFEGGRPTFCPIWPRYVVSTSNKQIHFRSQRSAATQFLLMLQMMAEDSGHVPRCNSTWPLTFYISKLTFYVVCISWLLCTCLSVYLALRVYSWSIDIIRNKLREFSFFFVKSQGKKNTKASRLLARKIQRCQNSSGCSDNALFLRWREICSRSLCDDSNF